MSVQGIAAAWFRREDWQRWQEIDPEFRPDYEHWLKRMNEATTQHQAAGVAVIKTVIDPEEFLAWATANKKGVGTTARAEFAARKAIKHDEWEKRS